MSIADKIEELLEEAASLEKGIKKLLSESRDYDLNRLLKKVEAEMMDLQHSLDIAHKFAREMQKR
jgi:hypothetical protein